VLLGLSAGRPIRAMIEKMLMTGEKVKKLRRLVARTLVDNAIDGDTTAARECFDAWMAR
jgi:hypothetical protein